MTRLFSVYSPSVHAPEMLERVLVGSQRLVADRAVDAVRDSVLSGGCHHLLFVGPRGIGKTHLVAVCFHRLCADAAIEASAVVAWLREEHYGIGSFADLAVAILRSAAEERPDLHLPDPDSWGADRESRATAALRALARERCVVVVAENLDDLFSRIGDAGQKTLRALIQETGRVVLLVTVPSLFDGVSKAASAFYGTFDTTHLEELSLDDAHELLRRVASEQDDRRLLAALDAPTTRPRLRVIESLAGGHPRIWMLFADSLSVDGIDELVPLFLKALDDLTPYYQERMRDVRGDQERIVMLLCRQPGALSVGEIADRCGLDEPAASSSIARLVTKGFLRRARGSLKDRRRAFYELREPLMRLCLQVKETRARPVRLIVDFLQGWYDPSEGRTLLELGRFDEAVAAYEEASRLDPTDMDPHHNRGIVLSKLGRFDEARRAFRQAATLSPNDPRPVFDRAEVELAADGWAAFVAALIEGFDRAADEEAPYLGDTTAYCELILDHAAAPQFGDEVAELVALYAGRSVLGYLGLGLVASIPRLLGPAGDPATSAVWSEAWSAAGAGQDDLVVPLRILGAAVGWQRDGDDAHLLRLPAEERAVLRDLLPSGPGGRSALGGGRSGH